MRPHPSDLAVAGILVGDREDALGVELHAPERRVERVADLGKARQSGEVLPINIEPMRYNNRLLLQYCSVLGEGTYLGTTGPADLHKQI